LEQGPAASREFSGFPQRPRDLWLVVDGGLGIGRGERPHPRRRRLGRRDERLEARGKVVLLRAPPDSGMYFGWFNSADRTNAPT
jgi:hypothetical protein